MSDHPVSPVPPSYEGPGQGQAPGQYPAPGSGYGHGPVDTVNPGKTLGVVGLVLGIVGFFIAFLAPIAGLICSILGLNRSKRAGHKNGVALAGIIVSIVALIANIIAVVALVGLGTAAADVYQQCQADPTRVIEVQGEQVDCAQLLEGQN